MKRNEADGWYDILTPCPRCSCVMDYILVVCWVCNGETNRLDYMGGYVKQADVNRWDIEREERVAISRGKMPDIRNEQGYGYF